eukprot:5938936-Alexandrium_andersonii.AAC.1
MAAAQDAAAYDDMPRRRQLRSPYWPRRRCSLSSDMLRRPRARGPHRPPGSLLQVQGGAAPLPGGGARYGPGLFGQA